MSSLRQVSEGDGYLQHFRSFAVKISDIVGVSLVEVSLLVSGFVGTEKFVFAFCPFITIAASSYALAAASAVSNVPSQILLFLREREKLNILIY